MSSRSHVNPIVLNFNEICLRKSDVQLLQGPHELNVNILCFYYVYLERIKYKNNKDLLFVPPEVTECIQYADNDVVEVTLNVMKASEKSFIFFILNDNKGTHAGGKHLSLIVLSKPEKTFFHFDTLANVNSKLPQQFIQNVKDALNIRNYQIKMIKCLQQTNGYDCGIRVLCMTDNVADNVNRYECVAGVAPLHQNIICTKRSDMVKLIQSLGGKI